MQASRRPWTGCASISTRLADAVSDPVFTRVIDVVWRLVPDRVLLRRVGDGPPQGDRGLDDAADLMGVAALVWVALDEPASATQIAERLDAEGLARPLAEIAEVARQLVEAGWARTSADGDT